MECPNCKKKIGLKLKFCPYCGKILSKQTKIKNIYYASKYSEKFHKPGCEWVQEISNDNLIIYKSYQDAIKDGKVPCQVCLIKSERFSQSKKFSYYKEF